MEEIDKQLWDLREQIHTREYLMKKNGWDLWRDNVRWRRIKIFELLKQKYRAVTAKDNVR